MLVASRVNFEGDGKVIVALSAQVIGNIQTAIGSSTLARANDVAARVIVGDPVCQGDVIETAADGRIGIRFIDGTVFNLSCNTRVVLSEFVRDFTGTLHSALFGVTKGAFAFFAGQVARTGYLKIDTPFGSIRGRAHTGGIGMLSLTALTFSLLKEAQAADPNVTFLDDGNITYKDLEHGAFELVTKEAVPRHIIVEDPGETVVLRPQGSSVSVDQVPNSPARMAELQQAQQEVLATATKGVGSTGSSTPPSDDALPVQPINFIQNDSSQPALNALAPLPSSFVSVPETIIGRLPPPAPTPPTFNAVRGLTETDTVAFDVFTPTTGAFAASSPSGAALTLGISGGTASSTVLDGVTFDVSETGPFGTLFVNSTTGAFTFVPDAGAINALTTPTATSFTITVSDGTLSAVQTFTIAINGTNDAAIISGAADGAAIEAGGFANATPGTTATGTLTATDVDNAPNAFTAVTSPTASDGGYGTFTMTMGGVWTYSLDNVNSAVQALNVGGTLTDTFTVTTVDGTAQVVTITIQGTNDGPVAVDDTATATEDTALSNINVLGNDTDVDIVTNGLVLSVSGTPTALHGTVTVNPDGTLRYTPDANYNGADTITYTVSDGNGGIDTGAVAITVHAVNDAPTTGTSSATVSEEGLTAGNPDSVGTSDTTSSTAAGGTIAVSDVDGNSLTVTLGDPGAVLTSGGQAVTWAGVGTHTLVGSVGATPILTVTINNAGVYTVTLNGPIDHPNTSAEDIKTIALPVIISDGIATTPTTLSVTIEDDSPRADLTTKSVVSTGSQTNLMLILDLSGSMDNPSGLTGLSRLQVAKAAVNELLEQYDNRGDVMVRLVTFSDTGTAQGSVWTSVADAKAAVATLSTSGATNYDAALLTAMSAFQNTGKLTGPGTQSVSYFLSDGSPTANRDWPSVPGTETVNGIQPDEQAAWEGFLATNRIISFAIGVGSGVTPTNLDPIAFDQAAGTQLADRPIVVTDLSLLADTLVFAMPPVSGGLVAGVNGALQGSFGGDSGFVKSITVDNVTYNFDPMANDGRGGITTSGAGIPSFTYDGTTKTLTVDTDTANATGGEFSAVMTTGAFTFQPTSGFTSERVSYVLADRDGDTASNTVTLSAGVGADINAAMLGEFESGNSLPDNTILGTFTATGDLNSNGNDVIAGQNEHYDLC